MKQFELTMKVTDCKAAPADCLFEAAEIISRDSKIIDTLLNKGRIKIDLIGESCNLEIQVKTIKATDKVPQVAETN